MAWTLKVFKTFRVCIVVQSDRPTSRKVQWLLRYPMKRSASKLPAMVFDFGGVLMDWNPRYLYRKLFDGDAGAMERFLEEVDFAGWNLQQDRGRPFAEAVAELTGRFPHYADLIRAYDERWDESVGGPIQPTVDILEMLRKDSYPLYGLSNWSAEKFPIVRARYEFLTWFEGVLVSGEAGMAKPDPSIYTLFLERIGRAAEECLFIDDSQANVAVARRLGFQTIRYQSAAQLEEELVRLGLLSRNGRSGKAS